VAALAGVLLITAWRMNEWHTIRFYFHYRLKHAMIAFTITLVATVLLDLTQAILIGFGISALIFMAQMSDLKITRRPVEVERLTAVTTSPFIHPGHNVAVYYLSGPLFFAAARRLLEFVEKHDGADATLILSLRGVPLADATGVEVMRELHQRQQRGGGDILITSMDERVATLLRRAGFLDQLGSERVFWSADQAITALGARLASRQQTEMTGTAEPAILEAVLVTPFAETMTE
jgi:SulP family sulfate permease